MANNALYQADDYITAELSKKYYDKIYTILLYYIKCLNKIIKIYKYLIFNINYFLKYILNEIKIKNI